QRTGPLRLVDRICKELTGRRVTSRAATGEEKRMPGPFDVSRRALLEAGLAGVATVASPAFLRVTAGGETGPIKIGLPVALPAESVVAKFSRANISEPMGRRTLPLYLPDSKMKKCYALGHDYAWGHKRVQVCEQEVARARKQFLDKVLAPTGTKDYSTYITK